MEEYLPRRRTFVSEKSFLLLSASEEIPWFLLINEPLFYSLLSFLCSSSSWLIMRGWVFEILQMTLPKPFMKSYLVSHCQWRHCLNDVSDNRCRDQCNPSLVLVLRTRQCLHHVTDTLLFFCTAMFVSVVTRAIWLATPSMIVTFKTSESVLVAKSKF